MASMKISPSLIHPIPTGIFLTAKLSTLPPKSHSPLNHDGLVMSMSLTNPLTKIKHVMKNPSMIVM